MSVIIEVVYKSFLRSMVYRTEVWLRILGNISIVFIQISIWKALLGTTSIDGINIEKMITYSIVSTSVSMVLMNQIIYIIDHKLKSGDIICELLKPINFSVLLFFEQLGNILFQLMFTIIPTVFISWLLFGFTFPEQFSTALLFIVFIIFAILISFFISYLIALVSFWFLTTFALEWMVTALITVFAGTFLPLWFFSDKWRWFAELLPFQYLGFIPAAIYMGEIPSDKILLVIIKGAIWLCSLWILVQLLWWRAVKRLVVQGG